MWGRLLLAVIAVIALTIVTSTAEAKRYRTGPTVQVEQAVSHQFDIFSQATTQAFQPVERSFKRFGRRMTRSFSGGSVIGGRPSGCPRQFCGCGASIYLFGHIKPHLNLAANWLRFPRAQPSPRMAAARRGHVFVLVKHIEGNTWLVHDSNSGRGRTRLHARSLRGYTVVNPNA